MDDFRYCEDLVREGDKDRYLATLFAPAERRPALFALYAFDLETRRIPDRVREPLAGEIRLQWWSEAIAGKRDEEAQANPVTAALISVLREHALAPGPLLALLEARGLDLYAESFATHDALRRHAGQTEGCILLAAARILAGQDLDPGIVSDAALALTLVDVLRRLGHDAAHGRVRLPDDLLARHGLARNDVLARRDTPALRAALAELRDEAERALGRALDAVPRVPAAARAACLPLALVPLYLRALQASGNPFGPADAAQWRRQLALWRAARHWRRL